MGNIYKCGKYFPIKKPEPSTLHITNSYKSIFKESKICLPPTTTPLI